MPTPAPQRAVKPKPKNTKAGFISKVALAALLAATSLLTITDSTLADATLYRNATKSIVWITGSKSSGSGTLVNVSRRIVITNHHVVNGNRNIIVFFPTIRNGRPVNTNSFYLMNRRILGIPATVLRSDPKRDLAIIRLSRLPRNARAIQLASSSPMPGERLHLIGNGGKVGALFAYMKGSTRQVSRRRIKYSSGQIVDTTVVASDMPTNPGDSGAAFLNDRGQLVAVNHSYLSSARMVTYGTDITEVRSFLNNYLNGSPSRPRFPVNVIPPSRSRTPVGTNPNPAPRRTYPQPKTYPSNPPRRDVVKRTPVKPSIPYIKLPAGWTTASLRYTLLSLTSSDIRIRTRAIYQLFPHDSAQRRNMLIALTSPNKNNRTSAARYLTADAVKFTSTYKFNQSKLNWTLRNAKISPAQKQFLLDQHNRYKQHNFRLGLVLLAIAKVNA